MRGTAHIVGAHDSPQVVTVRGEIVEVDKVDGGQVFRPLITFQIGHTVYISLILLGS